MASTYVVGFFFLLGFVIGITLDMFYKILSEESSQTDPELDKLPENSSTTPIPPLPIPSYLYAHQNDRKSHKDNSSIADQMYKDVRICCWVMTMPENLAPNAVHVNITWGKRCNSLYFMNDKNGSYPGMNIIDLQTPHGRDHLTLKTTRAFDYMYGNHLNECDWVLKTDDDTYIIMENLRYLLSAHRPDEPIFFGHHFNDWPPKQGYFSGGGGYILSNKALSLFGNRQPKQCATYWAEDVYMGRCMEELGVKTGDSRDALGRTRFHCFDPETMLHGEYPDWYYTWDKYWDTHKGNNSVMSDYAISFHYVSVKEMHGIEFFVYHLRPYGIVSGDQDLNKKD